MNALEPHGSTMTGRKWLGATAIACYVIHAVYEIASGRLESLLWMCHLGALLVGLGLLFRWPVWHGVGLMWLTLGVPLWMIAVIAGGHCDPTSPLTHVGGLVLGLAGVRKVGLPQGVWWKAAVALAALYLLSRWTTPQTENVNLAFRVWEGWEAYFPSYRVYVLATGALCCAVFAGVEFCLRRTRLARPQQDLRR